MILTLSAAVAAASLYSCSGMREFGEPHFRTDAKERNLVEAKVVSFEEFTSPEVAIGYFESIARGFSNYGEMVLWLKKQGFVVSEYRGLEAGSIDNENAIRVLATFAKPPGNDTSPRTVIGQTLNLLKRSFENWSFVDQYTGITILYSDESTFSEVELNPRGI